MADSRGIRRKVAELGSDLSAWYVIYEECGHLGSNTRHHHHQVGEVSHCYACGLVERGEDISDYQARLAAGWAAAKAEAANGTYGYC